MKPIVVKNIKFGVDIELELFRGNKFEINII